jgi:hypothetical protein
MSNKITLSQASNIHIGELADLPADQLLDLQKQAIAHLDSAKRLKELIDNSISIKYQNDVTVLRDKENKVTGTINFQDGDFKVISNIPKKVDWDQEKLQKAVADIKETGDDPLEYVAISYKISETKYNAWPEHIQKFFRDARLLKTGKETFKLEKQGGNNE